MRAGTSSAAVRYRTLRRPDGEGRREPCVAAPHPRLDRGPAGPPGDPGNQRLTSPRPASASGIRHTSLVRAAHGRSIRRLDRVQPRADLPGETPNRSCNRRSRISFGYRASPTGPSA